MKTPYPWVWRMSTDGGYTFNDEYASKDEACAALAKMGYSSATPIPPQNTDSDDAPSGLFQHFKTDSPKMVGHEEHAVIAECKCQDFDLRINANDLIESMANNNDDRIGEGDFINPTPEQEKELEDSVNAVISAWAEKHDINQTSWTFAGVRNQIRATAAIAARAKE